MIVRLRRPLERDPQQRQQPGRKRVREKRVAFDDAGVAVGGFLARPAAIDQRDRKPALGEVQRRRGADDAGAEHDHIASRHDGLLDIQPRVRGRDGSAPRRQM